MDRPSIQLGERYRFETPEQIDVSYVIAGLGTRFIAALIDTLIIGFVSLIIELPGTFGLWFLVKLILSLSKRSSGDGIIIWVLAGSSLLSFFVIAGYYVFFEAFWNGQTPGKRWLGIRVIREGGYPLNFSTSLIRNLVRLIDFLPSYYIVGIIVMFIDAKSRRLGDLAAGTLVVKEHKDISLDTLESETRLSDNLLLDATADPRLPIRDARRLDGDDRRLLRDFLQRCSTLPPETRSRIAGSLARAFALKLYHDLADETPEQFLIRLARTIDSDDEQEGRYSGFQKH
ncbi:MAG TPA: RDD family protein [Nitrolancea sp.]|jgi:uncharacterized RDD family membrane protein YckC|nr:RDD family protein [Nitrolancea sp.]